MLAVVQGGDEDDGSMSDGSSPDGSPSDGPESMHPSGRGSVHSVPQVLVINNDGEVAAEGDCPTTDDDSKLDSDSDVVWAKSIRETCRIGHTFGDSLYFTRDIPEEKWIPKRLVAPTVPHPEGDCHQVTPPPRRPRVGGGGWKPLQTKHLSTHTV